MSDNGETHPLRQVFLDIDFKILSIRFLHGLTIFEAYNACYKYTLKESLD